MLTKTIILTLLTTELVLGIPPNDKALFDDNPESRHRRKYGGNRPCRGGGRNNPQQGQGRTFFDWSLAYVDVNYNYNYNVNCGGGGNGGQHDGGGSGPNKPILMGILQGVANRPPGGGLFGDNGPVNFIQSQTQGIFSNLGSILPQDGLGSLFPQGGLFNGQGISSLFDNGLFSGIFNSNNNNNRPNPPPPNNPRPPSTQPSYQTTTLKPGGGDPDDIIYNDERPVHEDHDPVVPDYGRPRPGSYRPNYYYNNGYRQYQNRHPNRIRFT